MTDTVDVLGRSLYSEAEAARLLQVKQATLHYWLEGGTRRDVVYAPVLRSEATGRRDVSWGEFIEAGLLRAYRREHRVPMGELRQFIEQLRDTLGVPFPLAHRTPWVSGKSLVVEAQIESGLDGEYWLVAFADNQPLLTGAGDSFLQKVTFTGDVASQWRPHDDPNSPVRIDPELRFGRPAVSGISTETLWEHSTSGETSAEIAEQFSLSRQDVVWALAYESTTRAA